MYNITTEMKIKPWFYHMAKTPRHKTMVLSCGYNATTENHGFDILLHNV